MNRIELKNIAHYSNQKKILDDISVDFSGHNFIGLLSENDTANSVLLKIIAGIEQPDEGKPLINRINIFDTKPELQKSLQKDISFVFRYGALLSNLTIIENLLLPMEYHMPELSQAEKFAIIYKWLDIFRIPTIILERRPADTSQIIRKTMLIIRAFITKPKLILYDEPFIYLDVKRRNILIEQILAFRESGEVCQIFTSDFYPLLYKHSDLILILEKGKVIDSGSWEQINSSENKKTRAIIKEFTKAEKL